MVRLAGQGRMELKEDCLRKPYFQVDYKFSQQTYGMAIRSFPLSIVSNTYMEHFEELFVTLLNTNHCCG
jgi:hypothetical protein